MEYDVVSNSAGGIFMSTFTVEGKRPLYGTVRVSGAKNAALPIIFSSIATNGVSKIYNAPRITDVETALSIIEDLGAVTRREGDALYIDTRNLTYRTPDGEKVARLRASTYLLGACVSRFGIAEVQSFGGCNFSERPIDMHIKAAESFGAQLDGAALMTEGYLTPSDISFDKKSVGATVNSIIMAASCDGVSTIRGFAEEPHIMALIRFLRSAGAQIVRDGDRLVIRGTKLHGGVITVPGDMIEAGTFLAASLITGGWVRVRGFDTRELDAFASALAEAGVGINAKDGGISLLSPPNKSISVSTAAYPGFPTDLQPIIASVMASFCGGTIDENIWHGRFGYLSELERMGVKYSISGNRAIISESEIKPAEVYSTDLRGGAAAVLLALGADGESIIGNGEYILRGYEDFTGKLTALGARVFYNE